MADEIEKYKAEARKAIEAGKVEEGLGVYGKISQHYAQLGKERAARQVISEAAREVERKGLYEVAAKLYIQAKDAKGLRELGYKIAFSPRASDEQKEWAYEIIHSADKLKDSLLTRILHKGKRFATKSLEGLTEFVQGATAMAKASKATAAVIIAILSVILSFSFLSTNLTGYSILGLEEKTTNIFGVGFLLVGVIILLLLKF